MAVADVFDDLTSPRVYKPAMDMERVTAYIREYSGSQFDPAVVSALRQVESELVAISGRFRESAADS